MTRLNKPLARISNGALDGTFGKDRNRRFIEAQRVIAKAENPNATATQPYPKGRYDTV